MKIIYEPVKFKYDYKKLSKKLNEFKDCFIAFTAQYKNIKNDFKNSGLVLGCSNKIIKKFNCDKVVFVGDGVFHPLMIKKNFPDKKVIVLNPKSLETKEITTKDVYKFNVREIVALEKLNNSKKVGILVSTKPGQERINLSTKLKHELTKKGKQVYIFISDMINPDELMNFKGIEILINTACLRIGLDDYSNFNVPIINYDIVLTKYLNN